MREFQARCDLWTTVLVAVALSMGSSARAKELVPPKFRSDPVPDISALVQSALPKALRSLAPGHSPRRDVRKRLGAPAKTVGNNEFYDLEGIKFDTTITYSNGVLERFYHRTVKSPRSFFDFEPLVTAAQRSEIERELNPLHPTSTTGRIFTLRYPAQGIEVQFENTSRRELRAIVIGEARR